MQGAVNHNRRMKARWWAFALWALAAASSVEKESKAKMKHGGNKGAAVEIGKAIAAKAIAKGITQVAFDRNGYRYHGRVKALADAARQAGLKF